MAGLDPAVIRRVELTVSCEDADWIPKVPAAGESGKVGDQPVQIMHDGLLVELGCYFGPWMDEIIYALRGHHEPQEEAVFHAVVKRLRQAGESGLMIEFGSYWTYYGMWFARSMPAARVIALEPDPAFLDVGRRNAALNGLTDRIEFVEGVVAATPGERVQFVAESDGRERGIPAYDLDSLMASFDVQHVDLILADIQGAETVLLERAEGSLRAGRARFLIVSTHHHSISGSARTHQDALELLRAAGAHVIAEHTVSESFSGDGLIAVSFDERDLDLTVHVSHARAQDSLFGGLEAELEASNLQLAATQRSLARAQQGRKVAVAARKKTEAKLATVQASGTWRLARRAIAVRRRLRSALLRLRAR